MGRPGLRPSAVLLVVGAVLFPISQGGAGAIPPPVLPVGVGNGFVTDLNAPVLASGASGLLSMAFVDPLGVPVTSAVVDLGVYEFNAYPGNATQPPPSPGGVELENSSGLWGPVATFDVTGPVDPGASSALSVNVRAAGDAPAGTYSVRVELTVVANGTTYDLRSRGFFSASLWEEATAGPNGTTGLNLSRLGVSGVVPETAILVEPTSLALPLYTLLGASVALAGAGAYFAWRRGPGSSSGKVGTPDARRAESAFGKSRTSDGD